MENLEWLAKEVSCETTISLLSQYTPCFDALSTPPFDRVVSEDEYSLATEAAADLGFENGWIQGMASNRAGDNLFGGVMPPGHSSSGAHG